MSAEPRWSSTNESGEHCQIIIIITSDWDDGHLTDGQMFLSESVVSDVDILALLQPAGELLDGGGPVQLQAAGLVESPALGLQLDEEDTEGGDEAGRAGGHLDPLDLAGGDLDLPPPLVSAPQGGGAAGSVCKRAVSISYLLSLYSSEVL